MVMDVDTIEQILELAENNPKRLASMYIDLSYRFIELDSLNETMGTIIEKETGKRFMIYSGRYVTAEENNDG